MDSIEKASLLLGKNNGYVKTTQSAAHSANVTMITGLAAGDSKDGKVTVNLNGHTISDRDIQYVEVPTTFNVKTGDTVYISVMGADGTAKSMMVTGVKAGGDRMQAQIDKLVAKVQEEYGLSDSATTPPTTWSTTAPTTIKAGQYLWTRSVITNGKGEQSTSDTICVNSGGSSSSGGGIQSIDVEYYLSTSSSELTGGKWQTTSPEWQDGEYIWSRTKTVDSSGVTSTSTPVCIAGTGIPMTKINTAIDGKIDKIDNGGENLIRNSTTLDFNDYTFSASYVETGDNPVGTVAGQAVTTTTVGDPGTVKAAHGLEEVTNFKDFFVDDGTDIKRIKVDDAKVVLSHLELDLDADGDLILRVYE